MRHKAQDGCRRRRSASYGRRRFDRASTNRGQLPIWLVRCQPLPFESSAFNVVRHDTLDPFWVSVAFALHPPNITGFTAGTSALRLQSPQVRTIVTDLSFANVETRVQWFAEDADLGWVADALVLAREQIL